MNQEKRYNIPPALAKIYSADNRMKRIANYWHDDVSHLVLKGLTASARAISVWAGGSNTSVYVCSEAEDAPYLYFDLATLVGEDSVFLLPSSFKHRAETTSFDVRNMQLRTEALSHLVAPSTDRLFIVTYPEALTEKTVSVKQMTDNSLSVSCHEKISISFLTEMLINNGFTRTDFVYQPGQFSVRGCIVDVFSFSADVPYRIDFFGDEVDSIRLFELDTQLSTDKVDNIVIVPNLEQTESGELMPLSAILPTDCGVWIEEPQYMVDIMNRYVDNIKEGIDDEGRSVKKDHFCNADEWFKSLKNKYLSVTEKKIDNAEILSMGILSQPIFKKNFDLLSDDIYFKNESGYTVYILADNSRQIERINDILKERKRKLRYGTFNFTLHAGFVDTQAQICLYTDHQIFERYHKYSLRNDKMRTAQQTITLRELSMLNIGDYVVHVDHGIGVFGGLVTTTSTNGKTFEAIRLTFKDNDTLLVNVQSLHKISKYRGKEGVEPKINKLGTAAWSKLKERTKGHVKDIAKELIALYAKRKEEEGFAFSPDSFLQSELEASFLYEDTPDQYKANQAIKADMEKAEPMDRLVCGDVGFGKTELAIRAAFKAVCDNKQVAVLVPTTVLAFQHYNTFSQRLKGLPCKVEYLSRLRKTSEARNVIAQIESGEVNIIIGTHKIIGNSIKFKDLGLLIIDEEQRFGVGVKEKLRTLKVNVDTLTLSATPIPRTLQFSLMGARDLSVLSTPPSNRQPIVTEVRTFSEDAIRTAISNEIDRGGQVFFINNRIQHLYELQHIVNRLLPDVKTIVAHGQMDGQQLESIMLDFINGDYDVLLATTIIESGLDIPNANTIIVNNAHQFGLSELHQLRGRVGRSNKKAYCYLFAPPLSVLTPEARRRLRIIEEFSDLGSGFSIAMQDLDIRGTGDVLGAEQSGFISDIGYETYQKILTEALIELKQNEYKQLFENQEVSTEVNYQFVADTSVETDEEIIFPEEYVSSISERMRLYRELDNITDEAQIDVFRTQVIDRFGPMPSSSEELLNVVKIRLAAQRLGIERIVFKNKQLFLYFVSDKESAFYQSPIFTAIINWFQHNSRRAKLKEVKDKLQMQPIGIDTMKELLALLVEIEKEAGLVQ